MKYQYKSVSISTLFKTMNRMNNDFQKTLDLYSKEGWELVSFHSWDVGTVIIIVFKKEVQ